VVQTVLEYEYLCRAASNAEPVAAGNCQARGGVPEYIGWENVAQQNVVSYKRSICGTT